MSPRKILVLTYWSFADALVQTYTLPYLRIMLSVLPEGSKIFLVTLERDGEIKTLPVEPGIENLRFRLYPFGLRAVVEWRKNLRTLRNFAQENSIDTIHAWCMPAGAIGYLLSKRTGLPLIIDSYEPHAESMVETGVWQPGGAAFRILFHFEKKQTFHAKHLIAAAPGMRKYARDKFGFTGKLFVKPACVDLELFTIREKNPALIRNLGLENKIVGVYAGKTGGLYFREEVFRFYACCAEKWGDKFRLLLLSNMNRKVIESLAAGQGLPMECIIQNFVPHAQMPEWLSLADFGFTPVIPVPSKRYCSPVKDGEYWAAGLPVVITPGISIDSDLIEAHNAGVVINGFSKPEIFKALNELDALLQNESRSALQQRIRSLAVQYRNFDIAENIYREIYGQ